MKTSLLIGLAAMVAAGVVTPAPFATAASSVDAGAVKRARPSAEPIPLEIDMSYPEARAALIKHGWKPVITSFRNGDGDLKKEFFTAGRFLKLGWVEVEYCPTITQDYCIFNFSKNHHCLKVITQYEYMPEVRQFPSVMSWRRQCPSDDD